MKKKAILLRYSFLLAVSVFCQKPLATLCNPLNLNYGFSYEGLGNREAADPVIHWYNGDYLLFTSKFGGYWFSDHLWHWQFCSSKTLSTEDYAPTVTTIHNTVFFIASQGETQVY